MMQIKRVAVIGAGTMGRQIALHIARHGFPVALHDIDPAVLSDAETWQRRIVARWIDAGELSSADETAIFSRNFFVSSGIWRRRRAMSTWR